MTKFISNMGDEDNVTDELYLIRMRYWRDAELARTDWTQVADASTQRREVHRVGEVAIVASHGAVRPLHGLLQC